MKTHTTINIHKNNKTLLVVPNFVLSGTVVQTILVFYPSNQ